MENGIKKKRKKFSYPILHILYFKIIKLLKLLSLSNVQKCYSKWSIREKHKTCRPPLTYNKKLVV